MLIVIDGNWLFNRAAFTAKTPENIPWSLVSLACADALWCKATNMLIAFDGAKIFRYKLWPLYKINRKGKAFTPAQLRSAMKNRKLAQKMVGHIDRREIYEHLPLTQQFITDLGIPWVQYPEFEADDVLATYASKGNVIIDAPDKDLYQCLKPTVHILSTKYTSGKMRRMFVSDDTVLAKFGVHVNRMIDYQTLVGDKVDYIQPIVGPKTAIKLIEKYRTIKEIAEAEGLDVNHVQLNKQLVTLRTDVPVITPRLQPSTDKAPRAYKDWLASLKRSSLF